MHTTYEETPTPDTMMNGQPFEREFAVAEAACACVFSYCSLSASNLRNDAINLAQ